MEELEHSKANMASYGFAKFLSEFIEMAFTSWAFYFYERTIGLASIWVGIGYLIFGLYNAVNDPVMGIVTNRPFKFTKKLGRRFPWIMIGGVPYVLSYILIFSPPAVDPNSQALVLFIYLVVSTCVFDTFNSIFFINYASLFPDKFRSGKERRTATAIGTPIGILGVAVGALVPPLLIDKTSQFSYIFQAIIMAVIGLIALVIAIPGCREDQITVERYLEKYEERQKSEDTKKRDSFFKLMIRALKQTSFIVFVIGYALYRCLVISMQASIPYVVDFVLMRPEDFVTLLSAGFLVGALVSSPLWAYFAQKINNNKRVMLISSGLMVVFTIPLTFITNWIIMFIVTFLWGIGLGGYWTLISPVLADIIDESVVKTERREEGVYNGFLQFFGRLGIIFQALSFTLVHIFTGFQEGVGGVAIYELFGMEFDLTFLTGAQTPLAIFGIQMHFALIPAIVMLIGTLVFWKFYKLTPDKVQEHEARVRELKL
ncbi:MAG: putative Na+/melibiose symporter-like transporter [Promethearchaeota archaeon]|nr:MAG: putative Na+/melibiose symporter-like transporter [Candidatus Lokiarchaeota archaeon]